MQFLFGDISKQDYNPAENFPDQNKNEILLNISYAIYLECA